MAKTAKILTAEQIDSFVDALRATVVAAEAGIRLRELVASFDEPKVVRRAAPAKAVATTTNAPAPIATRRTRQPGLAPEKALAGLKGAKDGMSLGALAAKLGEKNKDRVAAALRKLRDQKKATVRGTRQTAKWFAS